MSNLIYKGPAGWDDSRCSLTGITGPLLPVVRAMGAHSAKVGDEQANVRSTYYSFPLYPTYPGWAPLVDHVSLKRWCRDRQIDILSLGIDDSVWAQLALIDKEYSDVLIGDTDSAVTRLVSISPLVGSTKTYSPRTRSEPVEASNLVFNVIDTGLPLSGKSLSIGPDGTPSSVTPGSVLWWSELWMGGTETHPIKDENGVSYGSAVVENYTDRTSGVIGMFTIDDISLPLVPLYVRAGVGAGIDVRSSLAESLVLSGYADGAEVFADALHKVVLTPVKGVSALQQWGEWEESYRWAVRASLSANEVATRMTRICSYLGQVIALLPQETRRLLMAPNVAREWIQPFVSFNPLVEMAMWPDLAGGSDYPAAKSILCELPKAPLIPFTQLNEGGGVVPGTPNCAIVAIDGTKVGLEYSTEIWRDLLMINVSTGTQVGFDYLAKTFHTSPHLGEKARFGRRVSTFSPTVNLASRQYYTPDAVNVGYGYMGLRSSFLCHSSPYSDWFLQPSGTRCAALSDGTKVLVSQEAAFGELNDLTFDLGGPPRVCGLPMPLAIPPVTTTRSRISPILQTGDASDGGSVGGEGGNGFNWWYLAAFLGGYGTRSILTDKDEESNVKSK